jgi:Mn-dependent DtxR family transcriptional regulator
MIIGSGFSEKNRRFLQEVARISDDNTLKKIPVKDINEAMELDRTEIKNILEYLEELGYLQIKTIGGPWLYGHVTITQEGLKKATEDEA